jgi:hypothetical protein
MTPEQNVSVVIDVNGPAHASPSAEKIKRRRVTTACTSCRERRVLPVYTLQMMHANEQR